MGEATALWVSTSTATSRGMMVLEGIKTLPAVIDQMSQQKAAAAHAAPPPLIRPIPPAGLNPPAPRMAPSNGPAAPATVDRTAVAAPSPGALRTRPLDHAAEEFAADPQMPASAASAAADYDTWVQTKVVELIYLGFDGDDVVTFLEKYKPEVVTDLAKYSEEQIESIFKMSPITARALEHPNWRRVLTQAKAAALESIEDEAEEEIAVPAKVN